MSKRKEKLKERRIIAISAIVFLFFIFVVSPSSFVKTIIAYVSGAYYAFARPAPDYYASTPPNISVREFAGRVIKVNGSMVELALNTENGEKSFSVELRKEITLYLAQNLGNTSMPKDSQTQPQSNLQFQKLDEKEFAVGDTVFVILRDPEASELNTLSEIHPLSIRLFKTSLTQR